MVQFTVALPNFLETATPLDAAVILACTLAVYWANRTRRRYRTMVEGAKGADTNTRRFMGMLHRGGVERLLSVFGWLAVSAYSAWFSAAAPPPAWMSGRVIQVVALALVTMAIVGAYLDNRTNDAIARDAPPHPSAEEARGTR